MTATLEWRKARRTGLLPAGLGGCALAAAVPALEGGGAV